MALKQVEALIAGLGDSDHWVRYLSAVELSEFGFLAKDAVPALIKNLADPDQWVSSWSARALGCIGLGAEAAIPALIQQLRDCAKTANISWKRRAMLPYRTRVQIDRNERVRSECADALGEIGFAAVPALLDLLMDPNECARARSVDALAGIRPRTAEVIAVLISALGDSSELVRHTSAWWLGLIGPEALPALVTALKHDNEWVRAKSAFAIGEMGDWAEAAIPALVQALRDKSPRVRSKSAKALNKIKRRFEERSDGAP